ncbi:hypothetical protein AVEN_153988-1, partial [Araneus ventricosus]
ANSDASTQPNRPLQISSDGVRLREILLKYDPVDSGSGQLRHCDGVVASEVFRNVRCRQDVFHPIWSPEST